MWQGPSTQARFNSHPRDGGFLDPADQLLCPLDIHDSVSLGGGGRGGCLLGPHCIPGRLCLVNLHGAAPRSLIRFEPPLSCVHVPVSTPSPGMPGFWANCLFTRRSVLGGGPAGTASEQIIAPPSALNLMARIVFILTSLCPVCVLMKENKHGSQSLANLRSGLAPGPF